jgi:hypothetical protein
MHKEEASMADKLEEFFQIIAEDQKAKLEAERNKNNTPPAQ